MTDRRLSKLGYTTNPTEHSTSKIFRSMSEIVLESSVESQEALAECSASNDRACLSSTHRALDGILQTILRQFCSSSEKICSSSARWDQWCRKSIGGLAMDDFSCFMSPCLPDVHQTSHNTIKPWIIICRGPRDRYCGAGPGWFLGWVSGFVREICPAMYGESSEPILPSTVSDSFCPSRHRNSNRLYNRDR